MAHMKPMLRLNQNTRIVIILKHVFTRMPPTPIMIKSKPKPSNKPNYPNLALTESTLHRKE